MTTSETKLDHLDWAVESRYRNQKCSLRLLRLFENYGEIWKTKKFARAAQDLSAVSFSLWRAAFLADKTGRRTEVFAHGKDFLERIIEDNSISYPQDRRSKEWTFNYYTRNARSALQNLHKYWEDVAPEYQGKKRNSIERWEYCQELIDQAVSNFESLLREQTAERDRAQQARTRRTERRQQRKKVRELTLSVRKLPADGTAPSGH